MIKYLTILLLCFPLFATEKIEITVGGYVFPPFVQTESEHWSGLTFNLINLLNKHQNKYKFIFRKTSSLRRFKDLENKKYDAIFFEDIKWGWNKDQVDVSQPFLKGGEVFISKKEIGKDQEYFNDLKNKSILGYLGYHYGFADFNANQDYLKKNFNIKLTSSHEGNILSVSLGRADLAIVTKSMLDHYFLENKEIKEKILISKKLDQAYNHTILVRKNGPISAEVMNTYLSELKTNGELTKLWQSFGIINP